MNKKEYVAELMESGWKRVRQNGETAYIHALPDREVGTNPAVKKLTDGYRVDLNLWVTTHAFSAAAGEVAGTKPDGSPLTGHLPGPDSWFAPHLDRAVIEEISRFCIAWGNGIDIESCLADYRAFPTHSFGARPVWHLAALALAGDVSRIESYQRAFFSGDRLGFVPYIDQGYIDRALAVARQR